MAGGLLPDGEGLVVWNQGVWRGGGQELGEAGLSAALKRGIDRGSLRRHPARGGQIGVFSLLQNRNFLSPSSSCSQAMALKLARAEAPVMHSLL